MRWQNSLLLPAQQQDASETEKGKRTGKGLCHTVSFRSVQTNLIKKCHLKFIICLKMVFMHENDLFFVFKNWLLTFSKAFHVSKLHCSILFCCRYSLSSLKCQCQCQCNRFKFATCQIICSAMNYKNHWIHNVSQSCNLIILWLIEIKFLRDYLILLKQKIIKKFSLS